MLTRLLPAAFRVLRLGRLLRFPLFERLYLAALFAYKRYHEDSFAGLAKRWPELFRGGHILDVGGNVGYTASVFAELVEPPFVVHTFEPEPVNVARLRKVLARRELDQRVVPVQAAVGDRCGEIELVLNESHPGDHRIATDRPVGRAITVPLLSLDEYAMRNGVRPIVFVKIDVQGFELAVSRGMEGILASQPRIAVAFEFDESAALAYGWDLETILTFYEKRGFSLHALHRSGILSDPRRASRSGGERGYFDILAVRGESPPSRTQFGE